MDSGYYPDFAGGRRPRMYGCIDCRTEVTLGSVEYFSRIDGGEFTLGYTCGCRPHYLFQTRFQVDEVALKRLLGNNRPQLPYRAAPGPYLPMDESRERMVRVFGFDCSQLESVEEFLLFCGGPQHR